MSINYKHSLLHERNLEKEVKLLPIVEEKLRIRIGVWEDKYGVFYASDGKEPFLERMERENKIFDENKKAKKNAKKSKEDDTRVRQ